MEKREKWRNLCGGRDGGKEERKGKLGGGNGEGEDGGKE